MTSPRYLNSTFPRAQLKRGDYRQSWSVITKNAHMRSKVRAIKFQKKLSFSPPVRSSQIPEEQGSSFTFMMSTTSYGNAHSENDGIPLEFSANRSINAHIGHFRALLYVSHCIAHARSRFQLLAHIRRQSRNRVRQEATGSRRILDACLSAVRSCGVHRKSQQRKFHQLRCQLFWMG